MRFFLPVLLIFTGLMTVLAQNERPAVTDWKQIPLLDLPVLDNIALQSSQEERQQAGKIPEFAKPQYVHISPDKDGLWAEENGIASWQIRIRSQGAFSLNLGFSKFRLPAGASLWIYSSNQQELLGPFTPADNEIHDQLWTPVIAGDELAIVVKVPAERKKELVLELSTVNHDFAGFTSLLSQACHLDVNCGAKDGWPEVERFRDVIRSVGVYTKEGRLWCTGFLINNTRNDCKPLFMTANHCEVDSATAASTVVYWNYQNSTCRQPNSTQSGLKGNGQLNVFNTGAYLRASFSKTDFALMELDDPIPAAADAFLAGWDLTDNFTDSVACIHHPNTDEKRISIARKTVYPGLWGFGADPKANGDHLVVSSWDIGATEGGSSGAPLFDTRRRVIGQLHGGFSSCGNEEYDAFGWIQQSWEGGGTPATRLKDWLDPDGLAPDKWDGKDYRCFVADPVLIAHCAPDTARVLISAVGNFPDDLPVEIQGIPLGVTIIPEISTINAEDSVVLTIISSANTIPGVYTLSIANEWVNNSFQFFLNLQSPDKPILRYPSDKAEATATTPQLQWQGTPGTAAFQVELSDARSFDTVLHTSPWLSTSFWQAPTLKENSTYYWRVRADNTCGQSPWSEAFSFSSANDSCLTLNAAGLPIVIDREAPGAYMSKIKVPLRGQVNSVSLPQIKGTHTYISDLGFDIRSPSGKNVLLLAFQCDNEDNFNIGFDDQAPAASLPCPFNNGKAYRPEVPLSVFKGQEAFGDWALQITDSGPGDGGQLQQWSLSVCVSQTEIYSLGPLQQEVIWCPSEDTDLDFWIGSGFDLDRLSIQVDSLPRTVAAAATIIFGDTLRIRLIQDGTIPAFLQPVIRISDGNKTATASVRVVVLEAGSAPVPKMPLKDQSVAGDELQLIWEPVTGISRYEWQIATSADFKEILLAGVADSAQVKLQLASGKYFWRVRGLADCPGAWSSGNAFTVVMSSITSLEALGWRWGPVPAKDVFSIWAPEPLSNKAYLQLTDTGGKMLIRMQLSKGEQQWRINTEGLPAGMYFLMLTGEKSVSGAKIPIVK